jgi:hypothetical protein
MIQPETARVLLSVVPTSRGGERGMVLVITNKDLPLDIPTEVAICPKCGSPLIFEDVEEWYDDGMIAEHGFVFNCIKEPDIDADDWWAWHNSHWSTPYVDWLPLQSVVHDWFKTNYRYSY